MMMILLGLFAVFVVFLYTYFTWNNDYFSKLGIPFVKPVFFFGNLKDVFSGKKHFGIPFRDVYKQFDYAPFFGFFKMREPNLVIRDLDIVKSVLIKDFNNFSSTDFLVDAELEPILMVNPFMNTDEVKWKHMRNQWSSTMTSAKIKGIYENITKRSKIMVEYLEDWVQKQPDKPLEARELAVQFLTDSVVTSILGLECDSFHNPDNVFRKIAASVFESDFWEGISNILYGIAPKVLSLFKIKFLKKETEKNLYMLTKLIKDGDKDDTLKMGIFKTMIKDKASDDEIAGMIFGYLSEGIETSSGLISFTLFELGSNPDVQEKLRKEIEDAAATNNGELSFEQINSLPYFTQVVAEVQRLYPAVLTMTRMCTSPFKLESSDGNSFNVPKGLLVTVPVYAIHMDEKYYPDPYKFDPERFNQKAIASRHKMAHLPFGEGPRICVGMRLALAQSKTAIAAIIRNFNIKVSSKNRPKPIEPDPNVMVFRANGGLWVNLENLKNKP